LATVPEADTKIKKIGVAPGAKLSVIVGAGAARYCPVAAFAWHTVMVMGSVAEPVGVERVMDESVVLPAFSVSTVHDTKRGRRVSPVGLTDTLRCGGGLI
jgi:hypothetical protein